MSSRAGSADVPDEVGLQAGMGGGHLGIQTSTDSCNHVRKASTLVSGNGKRCRQAVSRCAGRQCRCQFTTQTPRGQPETRAFGEMAAGQRPSQGGTQQQPASCTSAYSAGLAAPQAWCRVPTEAPTLTAVAGIPAARASVGAFTVKTDGLAGGRSYQAIPLPVPPQGQAAVLHAEKQLQRGLHARREGREARDLLPDRHATAPRKEHSPVTRPSQTCLATVCGDRMSGRPSHSVPNKVHCTQIVCRTVFCLSSLNTIEHH